MLAAPSSTVLARPPQLVRYLAAALVSMATDFAAFVALTGGLHVDPLVAHPVSRVFGGLTCFAVNRRWTFASSGPVLPELARFACVFGASLVLTEGLLALFWRGFGIPPVPAKALAEAIALAFNFLALSRWAFRPREVA